MIIAIGGLSRSGKSKLSKRVKRMFKDKNPILLHQDEFVKAEANIPLIRDHIDWEIPASIDLPAWKAAVEKGKAAHEVLILEGLFAFAFSELNAIYDKSILVEIPKEIFLQRKREDLRWGKEPEWYIQYIWEAYHRHGLPPKNLAVFRVHGNQRLDEEALWKYLSG
ncbi:MAG: hypothetical protein AAF696_14275 [Bacteroidota bacterium]